MGTDHVCTDEIQPLQEQNEAHGGDINNDDVSDTAAGALEAESADTPPEDDPLKKAREELAVAKKEAASNYDRLLRVSAEFDNYKKRNAREMCELRNYANESIIKDFLSVLDNLERALLSSTNGVGATDTIIAGVEMTLKEINKIMEKYGVSQVDAMEQPFNPAFHQAVMREETDAFPENTVTQELQKGYRMHDRLIRPAMVAVSAATANAAKKNETIQSETN